MPLKINKNSHSNITVMYFQVKENARIGYVLGNIVSADNGIQNVVENLLHENHVSYHLMPLTNDRVPGTFEIDRRTGALVVARQLDREVQDEYRLEIRALDTSATNNPQSSAVTIKIEIVDVNDNAPQWQQDPIKLEVSEATLVGTSISNFTVHDTDAGVNGEVHFEIVDSIPKGVKTFNLDPLTGTLTLMSPLDYEIIKEYWLVVKAMDLAPNISERMSTKVTVHITVVDANDNVPKFVSANKVSMSLNTLSESLYQALAIDGDSGDNGRISYYISGGNDNGYFSIQYDTGRLTLSNKYSTQISRIRAGKYNLNLTASDHGVPFPRQSNMMVTLILQESTNLPPRFSEPFYKVNISEDIRPGSFITKVTAKSSGEKSG